MAVYTGLEAADMFTRSYINTHMGMGMRAMARLRMPMLSAA